MASEVASTGVPRGIVNADDTKSDSTFGKKTNFTHPDPTSPIVNNSVTVPTANVA